MSAAPGVNVRTVARVLNLSVSRVHALAQEASFPPKFGPGQFDLNKVTLWYIRYLQAELTRRGPSGGPETAGILAQRQRLLTAQAEQVEKRNAIDREEYLSAAAVQSAWSRQLVNCRARLLALPTKLALKLVDQREPSYIAEAIRIEVYMALTELAAGTVVDAAEPNDSETRAEVEIGEFL